MTDDVVKLTGFKELDLALSQMTKATERGVLRRVAVKALQPVVDEAKHRVPVDEGHLRDSITIGTKLTRNAKRAARADPVEGVRVFAGTASRNGVPREFGTFRTAPVPFMSGAWESRKREVLDIVQHDLATEIDKTAKRIAQRAARKAT